MPVLEYLQPPGPRARYMNYKLPVELICLVLTMLFRDRESERKDIVNFSQVCRQWRQAALGLKNIWASFLNIDSNSEYWVKEIILRSGDAPLVIESTPGYGFPPHRFNLPKWTALLNKISRVKRINLNIFPTDNLLPILKMLHFGARAPILTALRLDFDEMVLQSLRTKECRIVSRNNSDSLLQAFAPNLKCLVANFVSFDPLELMALNLIHLEVQAVKVLPITPWLQLLGSQVNLEHLRFELDDIWDEETIDQIPHGVGLINLPNLQTFNHSFNLQETADLFGHLILPTSCNVRLNWLIGRNEPGIDPMGAVNGLYHGLERRFRNWAKEAQTEPWQFFFWQIELEKTWISVRVSPCADNHTNEGSCLELGFQIVYEGSSDPDNTDFDRYMDDVGSILFDMLIRSGDSILSHQSIVSVVAMYELKPQHHSNLIQQLTLFLSRLSSTTKLILAQAEHTNHFITHILQQTPVLLPNLEKITFEGDLTPGEVIRESVIRYLHWRSRPDTVGQQLPRLAMIATNEDVDDDPASDGFPQEKDYGVDYVELVLGPVPSLHFEDRPRCTACPFQWS